MATTPTASGPEPESESRRWWLLAIPVLAIGLAALFWSSSGWLGGGPIAITTSNLVHVTNESGVEFQPSISPDGAEVAYVEGPIGEPRIVVRSASEVGTGESRPAAAEGGKHWRPHWTPDGVSLRFWSCEDRWYVRPGCEWKETGSRGGSVRTVDVSRLGHYAWSRDGTRVAFAVRDSIYAYSLDNPEPELLGVHTVDTWLPHSLVWSPDGRWLAYVNSNPHWRSSANVAHSSIWILSTAGGEPVSVTDEEHLNVSPQWLPDSRHLLFVSDRDGSRGIHLVEVGPEGARSPPRSVLPSSDPHSISISADGRRLAYAKFTVRQNVWAIPWSRSGPISIRDDLGTAVPVTTGNQVIESFDLSPDGEWIAFDSYVRGEFDIYKQRLAGGNPQLVVDMTGNAYAPRWSPDGTELAFHGPFARERGGGGEVFVVSADGGIPVQLTEFPGQDSHADWSPDGLSIAFDSQQGALWCSWVVSRTSADMPWTDPVQLTDFSCLSPDWTPDGSGLVCRSSVRSRFGPGFARVSRGGQVVAHLAPPVGMAGANTPRYSPAGSRINFRGTHEDGTNGIWSMPADGGDATLVVAFDDPSVTVFGSEMGLDNFYFAYSEYESDIWVMDLDW